MISAQWENNWSGLSHNEQGKDNFCVIPNLIRVYSWHTLGSPVTSLRLYGAIGIPKDDFTRHSENQKPRRG